MNIWLVNPFDPLPSINPLRYSYLVKQLAEAGHTVTWWTSQYAHLGKCYLSKKQIELENARLQPNGRIIATWTTPYTKHVSLKRLINHVLWSWTFYRTAKHATDHPKVIIVSSPPLTAAYLARKLAKDKKAILVLDIQDLWPEAFEIAVPTSLKWFGKIGFAPLRALEAINFRRADALTAVSETYLSYALKRSGDKPGRVIPIGIDLDLWPLCQKNHSSMLRVCYAGTLGPHHDVETIIRAAKILETQKTIHFIIAGDGPQRAAIESLSRALGLSNVSFTGWLNVDAMRDLLMDCHIGVLAVSKGSAISIPAKTFDYMAAGLALISSVPGELQQLIKTNGLGISYTAADAMSLADAILTLTSDHNALNRIREQNRHIVETRYNRRKIHTNFIHFLEQLIYENQLND